MLLLPKLGEYGSFASFCNSSFLRLALGFLMSYRFFGIVARGPNLSSCDCKGGLRYRNVGKQFRFAAKFF